jgi:proline iminopeptidase
VRELYPPIEPYQQGHLKVSPLHEIYYEQSGNPDGQPVLFVHGGPGGGTEAFQRQFFDPAAYRIVLFDQRGAGKSRPYASLEENTTWHLVADMERLREELLIERWVVFGGSWGSALGLAYAETHPDRVRGLILRGIFLVRPKEIRWFYQEGASFVFPDAWGRSSSPSRPRSGATWSARTTGGSPARTPACAPARRGRGASGKARRAGSTRIRS